MRYYLLCQLTYANMQICRCLLPITAKTSRSSYQTAPNRIFRPFDRHTAHSHFVLHVHTLPQKMSDPRSQPVLYIRLERIHFPTGPIGRAASLSGARRQKSLKKWLEQPSGSAVPGTAARKRRRRWSAAFCCIRRIMHRPVDNSADGVCTIPFFIRTSVRGVS